MFSAAPPPTQAAFCACIFAAVVAMVRSPHRALRILAGPLLGIFWQQVRPSLRKLPSPPHLCSRALHPAAIQRFRTVTDQTGWCCCERRGLRKFFAKRE